MGTLFGEQLWQMAHKFGKIQQSCLAKFSSFKLQQLFTWRTKTGEIDPWAQFHQALALNWIM